MPTTSKHPVATLAMLIRTCIVMVALILCVALKASAHAYNNYHKWQQLSSEQLLRMGHHYKDSTGWQADSALVCYTIVAGRYYQGKQSTQEVRQALMAMINIGCIYYYILFNYEKALHHLNEAQQVAQKHGFTDMLASIHFNLSNLYTVYAQVYKPGDHNAYAEALKYCKLAARG